MNIVMITAEGYEHRYVANHLSEAIDITAIIVDRGKIESLYNRLRKLIKRYSIFQLCSKIIEKIIHLVNQESKNRKKTILQIFGKQNCLTFNSADKVYYVNGINTVDSVDLVRSFNPDIILIYGTGIIGKAVMNVPSKTILNMHTGISPFYRGAGCAFWPIYDEKLDYIGATVHECTANVDGGVIYGIEKADLKAEDNMHSVFARAVIAGADLYVRVIKQLLSGELKGEKQDLTLGKEYKAAMKMWWHEIIVKNKIKHGIIRNYIKFNKSQNPE